MSEDPYKGTERTAGARATNGNHNVLTSIIHLKLKQKNAILQNAFYTCTRNSFFHKWIFPRYWIDGIFILNRPLIISYLAHYPQYMTNRVHDRGTQEPLHKHDLWGNCTQQPLATGQRGFCKHAKMHGSDLVWNGTNTDSVPVCWRVFARA